MAMIAIKISKDIATLFENIAESVDKKVNGEKQSSSDMHITVVYLGDNVPIENISKIAVVCHEVASNFSPFMMRVESIDSFESKESTPVIMPVLSDELHELEQLLKKKLDENNIFYDKKWPDFKPHITLSYIKNKKCKSKLSKPIEWGAFELSVYSSDSSGNPLINIPFSLPDYELKITNIASRIFKTTRLVC